MAQINPIRLDLFAMLIGEQARCLFQKGVSPLLVQGFGNVPLATDLSNGFLTTQPLDHCVKLEARCMIAAFLAYDKFLLQLYHT